MARLGAIVVAVTVGLLGGGIAEATKNSSGPVLAANGDVVYCIVVNVGTGNISTMDVTAHVQGCGGDASGGSSTSCGPIEPGAACKLPQTVSNVGVCADGGSISCEVVFPSGKVRGSVCNLTKGLCLEMR
jgi:hypothetical protein